jgi:hypothetical protein
MVGGRFSRTLARPSSCITIQIRALDRLGLRTWPLHVHCSLKPHTPYVALGLNCVTFVFHGGTLCVKHRRRYDTELAIQSKYRSFDARATVTTGP